jgi:tripartite-type tricarboxylate transporter receptor subunit TctC
MRRIAAGAVLAVSLAAPAMAQTYPARPVRIVVPFAPGGGTDVVARIVGARLSERMGQSFIIDNRPAASGIVGTDIVAKAAPDGYTLLGMFSTHATSSQLFGKLPYDPIRDFQPISQVTLSPLVLVVHPSLPVNSVGDLVTYGRANTGKLNYGSSGPGSAPHLATELLLSAAGFAMTHVVYKGVAPYLAATMSGEVQLSMSNALTAMPQVRAGKLRALGSGSLTRSAAVPELPTIAEQGLPGFETVVWYGFGAPAKTPRPIIDRLHAEMRAIAGTPEFRQSMLAQGNDPTGTTPEQFAAIVAADAKKWGDIGRRLNIRLD